MPGRRRAAQLGTLPCTSFLGAPCMHRAPHIHLPASMHVHDLLTVPQHASAPPPPPRLAPSAPRGWQPRVHGMQQACMRACMHACPSSPQTRICMHVGCVMPCSALRLRASFGDVPPCTPPPQFLAQGTALQHLDVAALEASFGSVILKLQFIDSLLPPLPQGEERCEGGWAGRGGGRSARCPRAGAVWGAGDGTVRHASGWLAPGGIMTACAAAADDSPMYPASAPAPLKHPNQHVNCTPQRRTRARKPCPPASALRQG